MNIDGVVVRKLQDYPDERGSLVEAYRVDEMPDGLVPVMGYASVTKPGVVRGPHEHKEQTDVFVFCGPFDVHLWDNRKDSPTSGNYTCVPVRFCTQVIVPPGVVHAYRCTSDATALVLNFPDQLYKGVNKAEEVDEIRYENNPDSPFKVVS